ncbi:MAG: RagB/SusD family nutrient uptake outer membrane protein [Saprospiraceae bacterium]|nr:RagB/SusD family nutrient uptake outer membrane protein [Saprospiraceae bacterium]
MKNNKLSIIKIALLSIVLLTANSCKDFMEVQPVSQYSISQVFSDVSNATTAVYGVYDELMGDNGYGIRINMYYPYDSDEMICSGNLDNGRRGIGRYQLLLSNIEIRNPFLQLYRGIEKANLCIEQIPLMKQYTGGTAADQKALKRLHGEALTLRAIFYFELIRNWGDVPAPMTPAYTRSDLFELQTNRDETYDKLIADLKTASDLLPWRTEVARNERITKGGAKALRARMALHRGGFSLRSDSKTMERRSNYLDYYKIARDECAELMANRNQHTLVPSYEDIWKKYVTQFTADPQYELMIEFGAGGGNSNSDSRMGNYDGPALNNASRYGAGGGGIIPLPNYYYAFDTLDTRRDVTITNYTVPSATNIKSTRRISELNTGKYRRDWRVPLLPGTVLNVGYNWVYLRFSDVLLMFAEAENEINGNPTPAAIAAYEEVKKRAYGANASKIGATPTTKDDFFNAIVKERWLEFGGEAIRKYDLIRWNMLGSKIAEARQAMNDIRDAKAPTYTNVPDTIWWRNVGEEIQFYPETLGSKHPFNVAKQKPNPTTGWTALVWRGYLSSNVIDSKPLSQAFASFFTANKSELFPFDQATMDAYQGKLKQNPNY